MTRYKFIKPYTVTISGGIMGSTPKSFNIGDIVYGKVNGNLITASLTENPTIIQGADMTSPYFDIPANVVEDVGLIYSTAPKLFSTKNILIGLSVLAIVGGITYAIWKHKKK